MCLRLGANVGPRFDFSVMPLGSLSGARPVACLHVIEEGRQTLRRAAAAAVCSIHVTAGTGMAATLWIRASAVLSSRQQ